MDIATHQANAEAFQSIELDDLLANPEVEADFGDLSDDNQIGILNTLEKSISLFYNNSRLITPTTQFEFLQFN